MNIGLKLWSTNTDFYYEKAKKLYNQNIFDYIELYVVPNTLETIPKWKELNIPFILHAPHFVHDVNLADKDKFDYNKKVYNQVEIFRLELQAQFTIVHGGMNGTVDETIRQLQLIKPINFLIENKPFHPPLYLEKISRGGTLEEINKILHETECGFCMDISHAICTANVFQIEPYHYLEQFEKLSPTMYHLSDGNIDSILDQHLHFGEGTYSIKKIFSIIDTAKPISIETKKNSKENLDDFIKDSQWITSI